MKVYLAVPCLLLTMVFAGCASTKSPYHLPSKASKQKESNVEVVTLTGTRIPQEVDLDEPNKASQQPITIISGDKIRNSMIRR